MFTGDEYVKHYVNDRRTYPGLLGIGPITGNESVAMGVAATKVLLTMIRAADPDGSIIGVGYSQGASVWSMLNTRLIDEGYPLADLRLVLLGKMQKPNGGIAARFPSGTMVPLIGISGGSPTLATGAQVLDIANQYDLIADAPVMLLNPLAWANAAMGLLYQHGRYWQGVNLDDPRNVVATSPNGNMTSVLIYADVLPILKPLLALGVSRQFVNALDPFLRAIIETGYIRPDPTDPANRANDPSNRIRFQLFPSPSTWRRQVDDIVKALAVTARRLMKILVAPPPAVSARAHPPALRSDEQVSTVVDPPSGDTSEVDGPLDTAAWHDVRAEGRTAHKYEPSVATDLVGDAGRERLRPVVAVETDTGEVRERRERKPREHNTYTHGARNVADSDKPTRRLVGKIDSRPKSSDTAPSDSATSEPGGETTP